jgi:hypothetical protein
MFTVGPLASTARSSRWGASHSASGKGGMRGVGERSPIRPLPLVNATVSGVVSLIERNITHRNGPIAVAVHGPMWKYRVCSIAW